MGLTPSRNPLPKLAQNTGATGTYTNPDQVTVKDGAVTSVQSANAAAGANSSANNSGLSANAPLSLTGGTLTIPQATASADGYLSAGDYAAFASICTFGALADRPVTPATIGNQAPIYFAVDALTVFIWAGSWYTLATVSAPSSSSSSSSSSSM